MRILGVDPGCGGALALLDTELGALFVHDMPTLTLKRGKGEKREVDGYALTRLISTINLDGINVACVEQVGGVTGQSASAAFNFGRAAGAAEYALKAFGIRVEMVPPQTWRRALKVNAGKDGSRAMAARLWPKAIKHFLLAAEGGYGQRDSVEGRAEAALIAEYGRRQMEGQNANSRRDEHTASNPGRNGIFG